MKGKDSSLYVLVSFKAAFVSDRCWHKICQWSYWLPDVTQIFAIIFSHQLENHPLYFTTEYAFSSDKFSLLCGFAIGISGVREVWIILWIWSRAFSECCPLSRKKGMGMLMTSSACSLWRHRVSVSRLHPSFSHMTDIFPSSPLPTKHLQNLARIAGKTWRHACGMWMPSREEGSKGSMRNARWEQKLTRDPWNQKRYMIREFLKSIRYEEILFKCMREYLPLNWRKKERDTFCF